jgi:hypothetical protein
MPQMAKLFCIYCGQLCIMFNNLQATTVDTKGDDFRKHFRLPLALRGAIMSTYQMHC